MRRAASRGSIRVRRISPYKVEISAQERRYIRRSWPLLRALTAALRTERGVRTAVLFGSAARGDGSARSDIDLIVEFKGGRRPLPLARLALKLEALLGRPVQIVSLDAAKSSPALLADAVGDGRAIVDRDGSWDRLRRAENLLVQRRRAADVELQESAREALERFALG